MIYIIGLPVNQHKENYAESMADLIESFNPFKSN